MSTKEEPREGCAWTDERCEQFKKLDRLLSAVSMLNHSTNFIGHVQECIDLADELRRWDLDGLLVGFVDFLRDQIIEDRFPKGGTQ